MICSIVGFEGQIIFGKDKPDGTPRKFLIVQNYLAWVGNQNRRAAIKLHMNGF